MRYQTLTGQMLAWMRERNGLFRTIKVTRTDPEAEPDPNCVVLHGAAVTERFESLIYRERAWENFSPLITAPRSDFSSADRLLTFFEDGAVAAAHAAYIHRRGGTAATIAIHLRRAALDALSDEEAIILDERDDEWRELVFCSRRGLNRGSMVRERYAQAMMILAPAARWPTEYYKTLQSWRQVDAGFAWTVGEGEESKVVRQYVFPVGDGSIFLSKEGEFTAKDFGDEEYSRWLEEECVANY